MKTKPILGSKPILARCTQSIKWPVSVRTLNKGRKMRFVTKRLFLLCLCVQMGYISSVCSGGQSCAVLADQKVMGFISAIHELASRERQFYCWLSSVRKLLLTPLRNRGERVSVPAPALLTFAVVYLLCIFTFDPLTIGGFKYVSLQCKLCAKPN